MLSQHSQQLLGPTQRGDRANASNEDLQRQYNEGLPSNPHEHPRNAKALLLEREATGRGRPANMVGAGDSPFVAKSAGASSKNMLASVAPYAVALVSITPECNFGDS